MKQDNEILILLQPDMFGARDDMREIMASSIFRYRKELELWNILHSAYSAFVYSAGQFEHHLDNILSNDSSTTRHYFESAKDLPRSSKPTPIILEFEELSINFGTFLINCKAVLDKVVPLYSYAWDDDVPKFSAKGRELINRLKRSKNPAAPQLVTLIEGNKNEWIDDLITIRDEYAHINSLPAYRNFEILANDVHWPPTKITDFTLPTIELRGKRTDALLYIKNIRESLKGFLKEFIDLCGFNGTSRPKRNTRCDKCHLQFSRRIKGHSKIIMQEIDMDLIIDPDIPGYGHLVCPRCGAHTDADLNHWQNPRTLEQILAARDARSSVSDE